MRLEFVHGIVFNVVLPCTPQTTYVCTIIIVMWFLQETEDDGALKPYKKDLDYLDDHLAVS